METPNISAQVNEQRLAANPKRVLLTSYIISREAHRLNEKARRLGYAEATFPAAWLCWSLDDFSDDVLVPLLTVLGRYLPMCQAMSWASWTCDDLTCDAYLRQATNGDDIVLRLVMT